MFIYVYAKDKSSEKSQGHALTLDSHRFTIEFSESELNDGTKFTDYGRLMVHGSGTDTLLSESKMEKNFSIGLSSLEITKIVNFALENKLVDLYAKDSGLMEKKMREFEEGLTE